jgi:hypothetical protein
MFEANSKSGTIGERKRITSLVYKDIRWVIPGTPW